MQGQVGNGVREGRGGRAEVRSGELGEECEPWHSAQASRVSLLGLLVAASSLLGTWSSLSLRQQP